MTVVQAELLEEFSRCGMLFVTWCPSEGGSVACLVARRVCAVAPHDGHVFFTSRGRQTVDVLLASEGLTLLESVSRLFTAVQAKFGYQFASALRDLDRVSSPEQDGWVAA